MSALIYLLDDDESLRFVLTQGLEQAAYQVHAFAEPLALMAAIAQQPPHLIISDLNMPVPSSWQGVQRTQTGFHLLALLQQTVPQIPVVIMTAYSDLETTVQALQKGAFDYLCKPFDLNELQTLVQRALAQSTFTPVDHSSVVTTPRAEPAQPELIGRSPALQAVFTAVARLANSQASVLLTGESGTGKELVARALHHHSPRREKAFVAINSAAIAPELLEAELFGHEKGAFTGAHQQRLGVFETAHGGTLFLDEIGDMPLALQTRLLRVLAQGEFYRVGGRQLIRTDVRLITATHQPIAQHATQGVFRADLLYRLNAIHLHLPPLRERREDIPLLLTYFLQRHAARLNCPAKQLTPAAMQQVTGYDFPGNIRELDNLCQWITLMVRTRRVDAADLPPRAAMTSTGHDALTPSIEPVASSWSEQLDRELAHQLETHTTFDFARMQQTFERVVLQRVLRYTRGSRQDTAQLLGWSRNTVARKAKELES